MILLFYETFNVLLISFKIYIQENKTVNFRTTRKSNVLLSKDFTQI